MTKKITSIKNIIFPNKKINIFAICILLFGIIAGAIFVNIIGINDKNLILDKIKLFIDNINTNSINSIELLKNSLSINLIYIITIWILGMTMIGILFIIFLLFFKGFILSFTMSSFILTYHYKGIILSTIYLLFGQILNILVILILSIYSVTFSIELLKTIFKENNKTKKYLKKYFYILIIAIAISIISALSEAFILPALIKLLIKLFI